MDNKLKEKIRVLMRRCFLPGILVILLLVFHSAVPRLGYMKLLINSAYIIIMSTGMSFILAGGWVDISCGFQMSFVSSVFLILCNSGIGHINAIIISLLLGFCCGLINGIMIAGLRVAPTAAVITSMFLFYGLTGVLEKKMPSAIALDYLTRDGILGSWDNRTYILIMLVSVITAWILFEKTFIGRLLTAVKDSEKAVRKSGIKAEKIALLGFALGGAFFAVAAIFMSAKNGPVEAGQGVELSVKAILGAHLTGSVASSQKGFGTGYKPWRAVIAALIINVVIAVIKYYGLSEYWAYVIFAIAHILSIHFGIHSRRNTVHA